MKMGRLSLTICIVLSASEQTASAMDFATADCESKSLLKGVARTYNSQGNASGIIDIDRSWNISRSNEKLVCKIATDMSRGNPVVFYVVFTKSNLTNSTKIQFIPDEQESDLWLLYKATGQE